MKKLICYFPLFLMVIILLSCSKEKDIVIPEINIAAAGYESLDNISLAEGETIKLEAIVNNSTDYSVFWSVDGKEVSAEKDYSYIAQEIGEHTIKLKVVNYDTGEAEFLLKISVYGKYKHGTFILNEGNMTSEQGSLIFISPKGEITDSLYWRVNGSFMGNVTQDLFILDGKMYIISQNGGGDGRLIIANSETLKKEIGYNDEISVLSWPSHIAVIKNDVYIRDNKGIYLFNLSSKEIKFLEGSAGASKNRMAVVDDKVFVPAGKNVYVIKDGAIVHTIAMDGNISGIVKTNDKHIYVSCTTTPAQIKKISASDYTVVKTNEIADAKVGAGFAATPGISAKGDTIYFSNASTKIYRHIFSQAKTEYMTDVKDHIENAGIVYNNLAVHPVSGEVYFNTIKSYGPNFLINDITVFNFSKSSPVLKADYKNYTHFPAGIFFTDSF